MADILNLMTGEFEKYDKDKDYSSEFKIPTDGGETKTTFAMPIPYEPKRQNRFIVTHSEANITAWALQSTTRPTYVFNKGWDDITMVYLDPICPSTSQVVYKELIQKQLPKVCTITIKGLDPTGVKVEEWEIRGSYKLIDFSDSSYDTDELQKITIVFEPINCTLLY